MTFAALDALDALPARTPARGAARVLVVPGLRNSGPAHWQTWLQAQYPDAVRVEQDDWSTADLDRWARRIGAAMQAAPGATWVAVAHSFGCLALAHSLQTHRDTVASALLVAPADPRKFGVGHRLPLRPLGLPSTLIASETDPWMRLENAGAWALLWASRFINLGTVGHINTESGFGPFPLAREIVDRMRRVAPPALHRSTPRPIPRPHTDLRFAI